jgi:hypothetical protein
MDTVGIVTWAEIGWTVVYLVGCGITLAGISAAWEALDGDD